MKLKCIATGSTGNTYALISDTGEILLLDLGVSEKTIKKGIDWKISNVVGAVISHGHKDHSLSVEDFKSMGIPIYAPYIQYGKLFGLQKFNLQKIMKYLIIISVLM